MLPSLLIPVLATDTTASISNALARLPVKRQVIFMEAEFPVLAVYCRLGRSGLFRASIIFRSKGGTSRASAAEVKSVDD